ncbi:MAG: DUF3822 family protein, partial [Tannerella sp.]|jgi:hypothetical protein|nr:DUF3822 family protein [Tannerella sp.]
MSMRISGTLTAENAGKYVVSIRLRPGGLSFAGVDPDERSSFFCEDIALDGKKSYVQALKDAFFSNVFFTYSFKRIFVLCVNRLYTVVPESVFVEKQNEALMSFVFSSSPGYKTLYESAGIPDAKTV